MKPTPEQLEKLWKLARFAAAVSAHEGSKIPMSCGNADSFQAWVLKKHSIYRPHPECDIADAIRLYWFWASLDGDPDGEWQWDQVCVWATIEAQKILPAITKGVVEALVMFAVDTLEVEGVMHILMDYYGTRVGLTEDVVKALGLDSLESSRKYYGSPMEKATAHGIPEKTVKFTAKALWANRTEKMLKGLR